MNSTMDHFFTCVRVSEINRLIVFLRTAKMSLELEIDQGLTDWMYKVVLKMYSHVVGLTIFLDAHKFMPFDAKSSHVQTMLESLLNVTHDAMTLIQSRISQHQGEQRMAFNLMHLEQQTKHILYLWKHVL